MTSGDTREKIGIFGGTFSPPHLGHRLIAQKFVNEINLDKLLIIPTFIPPHKEYGREASPAERLEMCRLAFSDIDKAEVSDIEVKRGGVSYTADTLSSLFLKSRHLFLLVGTDMFISIDTWHMPERIFSLATVVCVRRENDSEAQKLIVKKKNEYEKKYSADIILIDNDILKISSSEIRSELRLGIYNPSHVPKKVIEYIKKEGLYK